ncbi:MAG: NAD(P)/FAD-dependent oxidoreductase [Gaiellaceae bacterium]
MSASLDQEDSAAPVQRMRPAGTAHLPGRARHRVVVVGGGFAGLQAVRKLAKSPVDVTLIDRRNFHLFQPLAYQVATGSLSPAEIASPLRGVLRRQTNARVLLAEVSGFDLKHRRVLATDLGTGEAEAVGYDTLIVAGGSEYSYFGHDEWEQVAPAPKGLEELLEIRRRLLSAFEAAETEHVAARRGRWLTFVVVGAGPTGVEMAGQIAEMARRTLRREFRAIDPRDARILLIEASDRVLGTFPPRLSASAQRALERLGVSVLVGRRVLELDKASVTVEDADGTQETIPACVIVWAAGVHASGLARMLADASDGRVDGAGRLEVQPDLTIPGHPEVFAIGDMITIRRRDAEPAALPGVAPAAMQQGRYAGRVVRRRLQGRSHRPFRYLDKGNLATIGKAKAVADLHHGVELTGFIAWLTWLFVHLFYLIGVQNRLVVFTRWTASFLTNGRSARIITDR